MQAALKEAASPFGKAAHHVLVVCHWGFGDDLDLSHYPYCTICFVCCKIDTLLGYQKWAHLPSRKKRWALMGSNGRPPYLIPSSFCNIQNTIL